MRFWPNILPWSYSEEVAFGISARHKHEKTDPSSWFSEWILTDTRIVVPQHVDIKSGMARFLEIIPRNFGTSRVA